MNLPNAVGQWNWYLLSMLIPVSDIVMHPDLPWDKDGLVENRTMKVEYMEHLEDASGKWNWMKLSQVIPASDIIAHPELPWIKSGISQNKTMTVADKMHMDQVLPMTSDMLDWNWYSLSQVIPASDIKDHPDLPWNRYGLSMNKTVNDRLYLDGVMTNAFGRWTKDKITVIPSRDTPMEEVRQRPDLPWNHNDLAFNPGVTVDDILYMGVTGDIDYVVSMQEVKANPLWSWDKQWMSMNPRITVKMVMANPDD